MKFLTALLGIINKLLGLWNENRWKQRGRQETIKEMNDAIEPCISAASIIAKEHRDRMMCAAAQQHGQYGWEKNKGYGTPDHLAALRVYGPTPLHRKSFAPVSQMVLL